MTSPASNSIIPIVQENTIMRSHQLLIVNLPPELSDQAACELLELLHEFAFQFENHYAAQIRRYREPVDHRQRDLWLDQDPPF